MFLSQLEIFGFKSFSTKLDLRFGNGITGIVGPNGCGKTNIVDAIRWVLGEQKTSLLRSEQMEDVIFNGTAQRKPLGMAEVSLTIDNTRGVLAQEYTEVMITRRLFRSGESEYLINKIPCRRRDIVELFMDTGMGPHAYSVIELSMVESILGGQPEALRILFEEAAGIAKYKARRREALRKLETTRQNLLRVGDIVEEVEKQVHGLRRQATKAERHQRYVQELRDGEVAVASKEYRHRESEAERLRQMLKKVQSRAGQRQDQLSSKETQAQKLRHQLTEKEQSLAILRAQLAERGEQIHKMKEQILVSRERKEGFSQQVTRIQSEAEKLDSKLRSLLQESENRDREAARATEELREAEKLFSQKEEGLAILDAELFQKRSAVERTRRQLSDLLQERNDARGEAERLEAQRETTQRREQKLTEEVERATSEMKRVTRSLGLAENRLRKIGRRTQQLETQLKEALRNRDQLLAALRKLTEQERELESQVEIRKNRLRLLQGVLESYEGYQQGVKLLLTDLKALPGIYGTVADMLEADPKYVRAVEAALGEAAQYILAETAEVAFRAIEHLRDRKVGKATFLILDRVQQLGPVSKPEEALSQQEASVWAPEVVTCDPKYRSAAEFLLSGVVIVDALDLAAPLSSRRMERHITWASLSGDVLKAPAVLRGGHRSEETGLLDRQRKILQEREEIDLQASALEEKHAQRLGLESKEKGCSQKIAERQRAHQAQSSEKAQLEKEAQALRVQSSALLERRAALTKELEELRGQGKPQDKLMAQLTEKLSRLESQLAEKQDLLQLLEEELQGLESKSRASLKESNEARVQLVSLQSRCEQLRLDAERSREIEEDLKSNLEAWRSETQEVQEKIKGLASQIAAMSQEIQGRSAERSEMEAQGRRLMEEESTLGVTMQRLELEIKEAREELQSAQSQVHDTQLQLAEIEARQQAAVERIQEEYQFDLQKAQVSEKEEELSLQEREKRIQFLRERIRTMGPVNLAALEEYKAQKERYDFLTEQRDDLLRAEKNLNKLIREMNRRARRLFVRTFQKVNQRFQSTCSQMFDGGEANLILDGKGDPLEANIEIYACPRGKRLRHIAQLSGGEKALTAISLLFSLYQVKPSPFCVLDEVDAPLDDVNIGRFVGIVKNLSQKSQFIIITHNKSTMAAADVLYGVTMAQPGVSKVVSVNLRQAEKR